MKILITADIHIGYKAKVDDSIWALNAMYKYAIDHGIKNVFILGDLFHDRKWIGVDILDRTYQFLDGASGVEWYIFPGNHDMFMKHSWEVTPIRLFSKFNALHVIIGINKITLDSTTYHIVPYIDDESEYMNAIKNVDGLATSSDILLTHTGVNNAVYNFCFLNSNVSAINFSDTKFKWVFTGHFHCHQKIDKVVYPGSPIPFRFDEGLVPHGFIVYDSSSNSYEFVDTCKEFGDHPAKYITITDDMAPDEIEIFGNHIRIILSKAYSHDALENLRNTYLSKGAISVKWVRYEKAGQVSISNMPVISNTDLFVQYVEHDKPDLDGTLLQELNKMVVDKAVETFSSQEHD